MVNSLLSAANSGFNWYGTIIGTGIILCILLASFMNKKRGYHEDLVFMVAIICIPLAVVGARLFYVAFSGYSWTFKEILGFDDNGFGMQGLAIYGGILGAAAGSPIVWYIFHKKKPEDRISFLQMFDLFFVLIILGQAIGRWGNFANQEAYGNRIDNKAFQWFPLAVFIDKEGAFFQATFFYESFLNLIGFGLLFWFYMGKRKSFDGFIFSFYCLWYGAVRLFVEGLRSDSLMMGDFSIFRNIGFLDNVRVSQFISVLIMMLGAAIIAAHIIRAKRSGKKIFIFVDQANLNSDYLDYDKSILSKPKREPKSGKKQTQSANPEARQNSTEIQDDSINNSLEDSIDAQ